MPSESTDRGSVRLNTIGYRVGSRVLELLFWRNESTSKAPKREIRLLPVLLMIQTQVIDNDPLLERHISVPKDFSQLSCSSFTAGIVEAFLDGLNFVRTIVSLALPSSLSSQPARVTAHHTPNAQFPSKVTILIKLEKSVLERDELQK